MQEYANIFHLTSFNCWTQDVSDFTAQSILHPWALEVSSFLFTLVTAEYWPTFVMLGITLTGPPLKIRFSVYAFSGWMCEQPQTLHMHHSTQWSSNVQLQEQEEKPIFDWRGTPTFTLLPTTVFEKLLCVPLVFLSKGLHGTHAWLWVSLYCGLFLWLRGKVGSSSPQSAEQRQWALSLNTQPPDTSLK